MIMHLNITFNYIYTLQLCHSMSTLAAHTCVTRGSRSWEMCVLFGVIKQCASVLIIVPICTVFCSFSCCLYAFVIVCHIALLLENLVLLEVTPGGRFSFEGVWLWA